MAVMTKAQQRSNDQITAWLEDRPWPKQKDSVPRLDRDHVLENYTPGRARQYGQFFSPLAVAQQVAEIVGAYMEDESYHVLEPSAGIGSLLRYLPMTPHVTAVEIDRENVVLGRKLNPDVYWIEGDAFEVELGQFDLVLMNPPYNIATCGGDDCISKKSEHRFLELAVRHLRPGGVGVAVCPWNYWDKRPKPLIKWMDEQKVSLVQREELVGDFRLTSIKVYAYVFKKE